MAKSDIAQLDIARIRCITFDLDDTLWACSPVIIAAEAEFYEWISTHYPQLSEAFSYEQLRTHRMQFMRQSSDFQHDLTTRRKLWMAQVGQAHSLDAQWVEEGFLVYWRARNRIRLFDGVETMISALKQRYIVGSMTNGNADIHTIGLSHLFDFDVTSIESGAPKPEAASFDLAVRKAGVKHSEVLHVGDDWASDIQGALDVGMQAVWVTQGDSKPETQVVQIKSLLELESILGLKV